MSAASQWDSVGALYSDRADFRFLESGEVRYPSAAAIREALRLVPVGQRIETEHDDVVIQPVAPGVAIISARFTTRFVERQRPLFSVGARDHRAPHETPGGESRRELSAPVARGGPCARNHAMTSTARTCADDGALIQRNRD